MKLSADKLMIAIEMADKIAEYPRGGVFFFTDKPQARCDGCGLRRASFGGPIRSRAPCICIWNTMNCQTRTHHPAALILGKWQPEQESDEKDA